MKRLNYINQHLFNIVIALILQSIITGIWGFFVALGLILLSYFRSETNGK